MPANSLVAALLCASYVQFTEQYLLMPDLMFN
jgi:hypothetical protein